MSNILKAIINIANNPIVQLKDAYTGRNTINNIGQALEAYVQDAFANTISETNVEKRNQRISNVFSYLLHSDDSKITDACRECEVWETKDIIYAISVTDDHSLKHLWLVYGDCYAASSKPC